MQSEPIRTAVAEQRISLGGDSFDYVEAGAGAPVLFLHGALADHRIWAPHCALLAPRRRCLAYTQRHHGPRPWSADGPRYGVATHARDLLAFLDALDLSPVTVVAWSYAGHVALHAAAERPDRFERAILFEPGVRTLPLGDAEARAVGSDGAAMFGPIFEAVARGDLVAAARALIDGSGGPGYFDALADARRGVYEDNAHTLPLLLDQEPPPPVSESALAALPVPVHVLWGERSRPASKLPAEALARLLPSGAHRELAGVGHLFPEEDPAAFCALVEARMAR